MSQVVRLPMLATDNAEKVISKFTKLVLKTFINLLNVVYII